MKRFKDFILESKISMTEIIAKNFLKENTKAYENEDGSWSCDGDLILKYQVEIVDKGKLIFNFKEVKGTFDISGLSLTTLEGCPNVVGNDFIANHNQLSNLKGGPEFVLGSNYNVTHNDLTSLEGCPKEVGFLDIQNNCLRNLKDSPRVVHSLNINGNKTLTSLEGLPNKIKSDFWFNDTSLPGLEKFFLYKNKIDFKSDEDYYLHILKYTIKESPWQNFEDLKRGVNWPKGFFTKELYDSVKGINKFNL